MNSEKRASDSSIRVSAPASPSTTRTPSSDATHENASPSRAERSAGAPHRSLRRDARFARSARELARWNSRKE